MDGLAFGGNLRLPPMHILDARLQGLHLVQLAVHQVQLRVRLEVASPFHEVALAGVGGKAAEGVDVGAHHDVFTEHADAPAAAHAAASDDDGAARKG